MKIFLAIIVAIFMISAFCFSIYYSLGTVKIVENVKITDKERVQDGNVSQYLIFTDNEVFKNTDSILFGKFNSSDVYNQLKIDSTYTLKVNGWRVPFISEYRNILKVESNK